MNPSSPVAQLPFYLNPTNPLSFNYLATTLDQSQQPRAPEPMIDMGPVIFLGTFLIGLVLVVLIFGRN